MKGLKIHVMIITVLLFTLMASIATSYVRYQDGLHRIAVRASLVKDNAVSKNIAVSELYSIYSGSQVRWEDGTPITAYTYKPTSSPGKVFAIQNLGITPSKFERLVENNEDTLSVVNGEVQMYYKLMERRNGIGYFYSDSFIDDPRLTRIHVTDNRFSCCRPRD